MPANKKHSMLNASFFSSSKGQNTREERQVQETANEVLRTLNGICKVLDKLPSGNKSTSPMTKILVAVRAAGDVISQENKDRLSNEGTTQRAR